MFTDYARTARHQSQALPGATTVSCWRDRTCAFHLQGGNQAYDGFSRWASQPGKKEPMSESEFSTLAERLEHAYATLLPKGKGFLPPVVPVDRVPEPFDIYQNACNELPERFGGPGTIRPWLDDLFAHHDAVVTEAVDRLTFMEQQKLMTVLCTLAHTYRWGKTPPDEAEFERTHLVLPPGIDKLWTHLAALLKQPRVGSLWNMALCNWSLAGRSGDSSYSVDELSRDSLRLSHGWLNPPLAPALEIFILTFVETEARGEAVVRGGVELVRAVASDDLPTVLAGLEELNDAIRCMNHVFYKNIRAAMIDPASWNLYVKPIHGWGITTDEGRLEGASGMQLGSIQCADAVLGIQNDALVSKATVEARRYMPEPHQRFLSMLDTVRPLLPTYVRNHDYLLLTQRYNDCVDALRAWRQAHQRRGALYLRGSGNGPTGATTGMVVSISDHAVTDFETIMQERIDETMRAGIPFLRGPLARAEGQHELEERAH